MIRQRGGTWQVDVMVGDKRIRRSAPTEEEAKALEKRLSTHGMTEDVSMADLLRLTWNAAWRTCKDGQGLMRRAELVLEDMRWKDKPAHQLTKTDLMAMLEHYRAKRLTDATINRKLASISKMLSVAVERGVITQRPAVKQTRERNGRVRFLTKQEEATLLQLLLEHEYKQLHDLTCFLLDTGCRVSEALGLKPCDVNETHTAVTFHDTKNGDTRTVPLTERAGDVLFGWGKLTQAQVNHQWGRIRSAMGLAGDSQMVPHILRHTCASRLVQHGIDLRIVKEWLGHKSITMTMRYAHLRLDDLMNARDVLDKLKPVTV